MTTATRPRAMWSTMPGWGIIVDLTPPELINSRHLKVLRKWIVSGLIALVAVCAVGYVLAEQKRSSASDALNQVQSQTTQLQAQTRKFVGVTQVQGTVTEVQVQVAKVMRGDVDLVKLMAQIRTALPSTMTIKEEAVTVSLAGAASAKPAAANGSGLDTSGRTRVGNVTISGTARKMDDLSAYVDKLSAITGVVAVVPISNVADAAGVSYSLSLGFTDKLLSHRFDGSRNGGK